MSTSRQLHGAKRDIRSKQIDISAIDARGPPRCKKISHKQQAGATAHNLDIQATVMVEEDFCGAFERLIVVSNEPRAPIENQRQ